MIITPVKIDELTYGYNLDGNGKLINNRLCHVKDVQSASLCDYDIDDQNGQNYLYDAIGNLAKDNEPSLEDFRNIFLNQIGIIIDMKSKKPYFFNSSFKNDEKKKAPSMDTPIFFDYKEGQ